MQLFKKKHLDERVEAEKNKIYRETYLLIAAICTISILFKFITNGISIDIIYTELIITVAASFYIAFRSTQKGIFSSDIELEEQHSKSSYIKKNLVLGIVTGVILGLIFGLNSAINYADTTGQSIYYFFLTFVTTLLFYVPVLVVILLVGYTAAKKSSDKAIERQLEDDEG
ncbi:DUF6773 family protein [Gracilibacillus marinus]|uniref:DUF6773 family protein n=1 Tax=Gracilibacillus marinus TaxID=630535 RepID=A0ABV8VY89_9BACI